jgi:hypothetical protein
MKIYHRESLPAIVPGTVTALLLLAFSPGCAQKAQSRSEAEQRFLAPTDINKLTPEARARLPRGGGAPPVRP